MTSKTKGRQAPVETKRTKVPAKKAEAAAAAAEKRSLEELAREIKAELEGIATGARTTFEHAMRAGELLLQAKEQEHHGKWLKWLRENCNLSERTAQKYMRIATHRADFEANPPFAADLGVEGALSVLRSWVIADSKDEDDESAAGLPVASAETRSSPTAPAAQTEPWIMRQPVVPNQPDEVAANDAVKADGADDGAQDEDEDAEVSEATWLGRRLIAANKAAGFGRLEDWTRFPLDAGTTQAVENVIKVFLAIRKHHRKGRDQPQRAGADADNVVQLH
jgi:hypothetical protein